MSARRFRILMVCLGNICRSPTAEGVLRRLLTQEAPDLHVDVDSAGTADYHIGEPPDSRSQRAALSRGVDLSSLRARQVAPRDFADFDLILAMDQDNLRALEALRIQVAASDAARIESSRARDRNRSHRLLERRIFRMGKRLRNITTSVNLIIKRIPPARPA